MKTDNEIKKELEGISPKMADLPRKDAFNVPEDYFTQLPGEIQKRINENDGHAIIVRKHFLHSKAVKWAAAASIVILLGSGYYYISLKSNYNYNNVSTESFVIENVDEETISEYISDIPTKPQDKNKEAIDNSLDNIDEDLIIEDL
jgi:hypothetical protein